jgi:hypothetical protein
MTWRMTVVIRVLLMIYASTGHVYSKSLLNIQTINDYRNLQNILYITLDVIMMLIVIYACITCS